MIFFEAFAHHATRSRYAQHFAGLCSGVSNTEQRIITPAPHSEQQHDAQQHIKSWFEGNVQLRG